MYFDEVMEILEDLRPDIDFDEETALIDDKLLESFDIITLVATLNDTFDISIGPKELKAENFNSAKAISELVETLKKA